MLPGPAQSERSICNGVAAVLAQISVYMLAPAPVPGVKTAKSSGPAEPALPNMVAGLCSEPLFYHIWSSRKHISSGICVMWYISRPKLTLYVYLRLVLEVGTLPEMLLQKSAHIWNYLVWLLVWAFFSPYNLRYFNLPEVVKSTVLWPLLSPPARLQGAAMLKVCLNIRKCKEWKESRIATVASVHPEDQ